MELAGYKDDHIRRVGGVELMRGMNRLSAALAEAKPVVAPALQGRAAVAQQVKPEHGCARARRGPGSDGALPHLPSRQPAASLKAWTTGSPLVVRSC